MAFAVDADGEQIGILGIFHGAKDYETALACEHPNEAEH